VVTPYQRERCIAYIAEQRPDISYAKVCRVIGRSRTSIDYKRRMPEKDEQIKQAIASVLGTSRMGRKKVIVKVKKKYSELLPRKSAGCTTDMDFRFIKD